MAIKSKGQSLRTRLLGIVIACWILPLIFIMTGLTYYFSVYVVNSQRNAIAMQLDSCQSVAVDRLQSAISEAASVSTDKAVSDAYNSYKQSNDLQRLKQESLSYLEVKFSGSALVDLCMIEFDDGKTPVSVYKTDEIYNKFIRGIYPKAELLTQESHDVSSFITSGRDIYIVKNLIDPVTLNPYAMLSMKINTDYVFGFFSDGTKLSGNIDFSIDGSKGSTDNKFAVVPRGFDINTIKESFIKSENSKTYFYRHVMFDNYILKYCISVENSSLYGQYYIFFALIIGAAVIIIPFAFYFLSFFKKNITKPLSALVIAARELERGNVGYTLPKSKKTDELSRLSAAFNVMSITLQNLFDKAYKEEIAFKDAKIKALQSQINPHFLNNTLELMNWKARGAGNEELANMIEALSTLLDASLDRSDKKQVPLSDELLSADAYLYIIKVRYKNKIKIEKNIDEELLRQSIPRLIIQPMLENAVKHGIKTAKKGILILNIYKENNYMVIEIRNDGKVLTQEDFAHLDNVLNGNAASLVQSDTTGIGINNVNTRIKLISGPGFGISYSQDEKLFTVTKMLLPLGDEYMS